MRPTRAVRAQPLTQPSEYDAMRRGRSITRAPCALALTRPLTLCSRTRCSTADGSRTAEIASHGRLTACRSRLTGYPDRAYDRRASLFFRWGALCMLACVVQGSCVHSVGFRTAVCVIRRPLLRIGSHTTLQDTHYREQARECVLELEMWRCVAKRFTGRYSSRSRISMHISKDRETAHS